MAEFVAVANGELGKLNTRSTFCWYNISEQEKGFFLCMRDKRSDGTIRNEKLITRSLDAKWDGYNEWWALTNNGSYLDFWEDLDNATEIGLVSF